MAAYMKTDAPFLGVSGPGRKEVLRELKQAVRPGSAAEVLDLAERLWALPHREERYLALAVAAAWPKHVTLDGLPTYERWIREGAWWDTVDEIAGHLVGPLWIRHPDAIGPVMDRWIDDEDLWIRRVAILGQNRRRGATDTERLHRYCLARAHEKEFFIRKAIGWALREHAKTDPDGVRAFTEAHRDRWAGLTWREARKHLDP